jgi:cytidylate kinase
MTTITISREIGSKGDWVAEEASQRLGYHLVTKHTVERIFLQYGFIDFNEMYDSSGFWSRFDPQVGEMVGMLNHFVQALAAHGKVVLIGRGGFAMLKNYADVLNVRIQAPLEKRIDQVMREEKLTDRDKAEEIVKESDHIRKHFLKTAYGSQWDAANSFDLVLDTGKINPEITVEMIVDSALRIENNNKAGQVTTASLDIDPVMANAIREIFDEIYDEGSS